MEVRILHYYAAAAPNNRKKDASRLKARRDRLKRKLASSRLVSLLDGTHVYLWTTKRDDFFAVDVICHGRGRDSNKETRTTFLRSKNAKREDIKKRIDRVR